MGIVIAILIFLIIILIHEFGHLIVAKIMGVGIVEYSVGMGPLIWSWRGKETVYSIRLVPLGGYCAMYGEESLEAGDKGQNTEANKEAPEKTSAKKRTFLFGEPDYKTDWTPDRELNRKSPWKRLAIYVAGPSMNMILGLVACILVVGIWFTPTVPIVQEISEGSPAEESSIQIGDQITAVNNRRVLDWNDYQEYMTSHTNLTENGFTITVDRAGSSVVIPAKFNDEGLFGITVEQVEVYKDLPTVLTYTGNEVRYMVHSVTDSLYMLVHGSASVNDLSGVVGMTAMISESVEESSEAEVAGEATGGQTMYTILFLMALLSINIGLLNLLPIPALDGGRIVMCIYEGISRRRVPERVEWAVNALGMCLLMILMGYVMFHDIIRLWTGTLFTG